MFNIKFCQGLDSNCRSLVSEATAMPIQPQPLPLIQICLRHRLLIETKLFSSLEKFLSSSSDEVQNSLKSGLLKTVVQELKGLLHDLLRKEAKGSCLACGADVNERMKLEIQLHKSTENYEKLDRRMRQQEEEAKRKAEEIIDLKGKVRITFLSFKIFKLFLFLVLWKL